MKRALILGITGQDGSYLAELLLEKGYEVHGSVRRSSLFNTGRIDHLLSDSKNLKLHFADTNDSSSLRKLISTSQPEEVYNLAAQSHVRVSFDIPEFTAEATAMGTLRLLNAIVESGLRPRYYQASSSEMFGKVQETPQKETTPFYPRSPYAVSKVFGYWTTVNFREAYGLHASNGILFNHESPRRGETFVTRKITKGLAKILAGKQDKIILGNIDAKRDWGHAKDYVRAMWQMVQAPQGGDYVVATGETHSVEEFLKIAFGLVGLDWKNYVTTDERYKRPTEVDLLLGDPTKIKTLLGWQPEYDFKGLVYEMIEHDLKNEGLDPAKFIVKNGTPIENNVFNLSKKSTRTVSVKKPNQSFSDLSGKVFVAGHRGLVGAALLRGIAKNKNVEVVTRTHEELDLTNQNEVEAFFKKEKPEYVFLSAGKVGGIQANSKFPVEFLLENISIAINTIKTASLHNVKKLVYLGSSCIYPKFAEQPISENSLLTGPLEPTNEGYALAKITGVKLCEYYYKQYGKTFVSAMPTNLYGPHDNFHPEYSHVVPGMLRRFHEAKIQNLKAVQVWGSGVPLREFMHVDDLASALLLVMASYDSPEIINLGSGQEVSIRELAQIIKEVVGFDGKIEFNSNVPDGTPRKALDSSKLLALGFSVQMPLKQGLKEAYEWALKNEVFTMPYKKVA